MERFRIGISRGLLAPDGLPFYDMALELLDADPAVEWAFLNRETRTLEPEDIEGFDAVLGCIPTRATFATGASRLVALANWGVGMNGWDLEACTEAGVLAFNSKGSNKHGVAAACLGYMLALPKRFVEQDRAVRAGLWPNSHWYPGARDLIGHEIQHKTLGLIGFGDIALELVRLVAPFEMRILAYTPRLTPERARAHGAEAVSLDDLLRRSDFVSLHCPLTPESHGMLGRHELSLMKPTAYLINVCRAALVDQDFLAEVLAERRIAGAAVATFDPMPFPADHPLLKADNALFSPHMVGGSHETCRNQSVVAHRGLLKLAHGELPSSIQNPAVVDRSDFRQKLARFAARVQAP